MLLSRIIALVTTSIEQYRAFSQSKTTFKRDQHIPIIALFSVFGKPGFGLPISVEAPFIEQDVSCSGEKAVTMAFINALTSLVSFLISALMIDYNK